MQPANPAFLKPIGKTEVQVTEIEGPTTGPQIFRTRRTAVIAFPETGGEKNETFGRCDGKLS